MEKLLCKFIEVENLINKENDSIKIIFTVFGQIIIIELFILTNIVLLPLPFLLIEQFN